MARLVIGSYSENPDPVKNPRDYIRFRLNDLEEPFLLSDLEIDNELSKSPVLYAAHHLAHTIAARFARRPTMSILGSSVNARELFLNYTQIASDLLEEYRQDNMAHNAPSIGKVQDSVPENIPSRTKPVDIEQQGWDPEHDPGVQDVSNPARLERGVI